MQGVERAVNSKTGSMAVIYHGAFKVIIPAEEAVTLPDDTRGRSPDELYHYMLTKRLGAEVDYIVKGIDQQSNLAVGSRLDAMTAKRKGRQPPHLLRHMRRGPYRFCHPCRNFR